MQSFYGNDASNVAPKLAPLRPIVQNNKELDEYWQYHTRFQMQPNHNKLSNGQMLIMKAKDDYRFNMLPKTNEVGTVVLHNDNQIDSSAAVHRRNHINQTMRDFYDVERAKRKGNVIDTNARHVMQPNYSLH